MAFPCQVYFDPTLQRLHSTRSLNFACHMIRFESRQNKFKVTDDSLLIHSFAYPLFIGLCSVKVCTISFAKDTGVVSDSILLCGFSMSGLF